MAFDQNRGVSVVFGGGAFGNGTNFNDAWTWDGGSGQNVTPSTCSGSGP